MELGEFESHSTISFGERQTLALADFETRLLTAGCSASAGLAWNCHSGEYDGIVMPIGHKGYADSLK